MGYFSDHVGLRGDLRYLRAMSDLTTNVASIDVNGDKLHFWRASIGVSSASFRSARAPGRFRPRHR